VYAVIGSYINISRSASNGRSSANVVTYAIGVSTKTWKVSLLLTNARRIIKRDTFKIDK